MSAVVAAEPLPLGVDVWLSVPNLLVGMLGLVAALVVAVRFGSRVSLLAGLGGACYLVSEMVWLAYLFATRPRVGARPSVALLNASNAAIAGLQVAGMALLVLAVVAAGARGWRRVALVVGAVVLLALVAATAAGWYRGSTRIPQTWLQAPPVVVGVVGLALALVVARPLGRWAPTIMGLSSALWVLWGGCAVWYASMFPGPHASQQELTRFYRDTRRLSHLTAVGNEVYALRRLLAAIAFGLVVLATAPPRTATDHVRLLAAAAALGLVLATVGVVLGWVLGPGQTLPQLPEVPR
jgi:hypothetical protein